MRLLLERTERKKFTPWPTFCRLCGQVRSRHRSRPTTRREIECGQLSPISANVAEPSAQVSSDSAKMWLSPVGPHQVDFGSDSAEIGQI